MTFVDGVWLARFRADPAKVRVSIRQTGSRCWLARVVSRDGTCIVTATATGPRKALVKALVAAERARMPGIDLGMGRSYVHPFGAAA